MISRPWLFSISSLIAGASTGYLLRITEDGPAVTIRQMGQPGKSAEERPMEFSRERFQASSGLAMHRMLAQVLPEADLERVRMLWANLVQRSPIPPEAVWRALMARWVQLEPVEALAEARKLDLKMDWLRLQGFRVNLLALQAWAKVDLEAALTGVYRPDIDEWATVLEVMTKSDPRRAWSLLAASKQDGTTPSKMLGHLEKFMIERWAASDPFGAMIEVKARGFEHVRSFIQGWAAQDAAGCVAWIFSQKNSDHQRACFGGLGHVAKEHPTEVAAALNGKPMNLAMRWLAENVAESMATKDPEAATAWVRERFPEGAMRADALVRVAAVVVKKDPLAAVAIMDEMGWRDHPTGHSDSRRKVLPGGEGATDRESIYEGVGSFEVYTSVPDTINDVMRAVAKTDPVLAARCFEKAPTDAKGNLLGAIVPAWFEQDPSAALQWLSTVPAGRTSPEQLAWLVRDMKLDPAAAADWARQLPPSLMQQALVAASVKQLTSDPATAMEQLDFPDPAARRVAVDEIARQWAVTAPQQALERIVAERSPMPETCQQVVAAWTQRDPGAASSWVQQLPPGANRDGSIRGMIETLTIPTGDPDFSGALTWALNLSDAKQRAEQAQQVLERWPNNDQEAATLRQILTTSSGLPEADRLNLLQRLQP